MKINIVYITLCKAIDIMTAGELARVTGLSISQVRKEILRIRRTGRKITSFVNQKGGYMLASKPFAPKNIVPFAV